jgi:hypothetical protein
MTLYRGKGRPLANPTNPSGLRYFLVPASGLEPELPYGNEILSALRHRFNHWFSAVF